MANTEYKQKTLAGLSPASPNPGSARARTPMRWPPLRNVIAAQDTIPASSRRIVARYSLSGARDWNVPSDVDPGSTAQPYPDPDTDRLAVPFRHRLTPGCQLEAHVLYVPSGLTTREGDPPEIGGAFGIVTVRVTWTRGSDSTGPHDFEALLEGSPFGQWGGSAPAAPFSAWAFLKEKRIEQIQPPGYQADPAVAAAYAEWATVTGAIYVRGAPRCMVVLYEVPVLHTSVHDDDGPQTVHALAAAVQQTPMPMTKAVDGPDFEEHRHGTRRLLQVAERQWSRLGPAYWLFTSWDEAAQDWLDDDLTPVTFDADSWADLWNPSITSYGPNNPGFIVSGAHALHHRWNDPDLIMPSADRAVIPVRIHVYAQQRGDFAGVVRVQTSALEWEDVPIAPDSAPAWHTQVGLVAAQLYDDQADVNGQILCRVPGGPTGDELDVYAVAMEFGEW